MPKMLLSPYRIILLLLKQMKPSPFFNSQRLPTAPNPDCHVYITLKVFIKTNLSLHYFVSWSIYLLLKLRSWLRSWQVLTQHSVNQHNTGALQAFCSSDSLFSVSVNALMLSVLFLFVLKWIPRFAS